MAPSPTHMAYGASWASDAEQDCSWCSGSVPAIDDIVLDCSGCSGRLSPPHRSPVEMAACSTANTMAVTHDGRSTGDSLQRPYTCGAALR